MSERTVIIGNGIAGITAARFLRKASDGPITIVSAETTHHFARTALMYAYMGHLDRNDLKPFEDYFWKKNNLELRREYATVIETEAREVHLASGERLGYDRLGLATGSRPVRYDWPGQHLSGVQGLYKMQDLDAMEQSTHGVRHAVVVGGGLIGIEMAEMLRSRRIAVTFLVRETAYMDFLFSDDESAMIHRQIERHGVDLRLKTELVRIEDDGAGGVAAVHTSDGERIECGFVGIATGVKPRIELAEASGIETGRGILIERNFKTSALNVYAAGDCAEFRTPLSHGGTVEQLWY
ncbi:MAG: FAD-dependent oxidoreductase, partial [Rhodothermales bacterium]|nr:FAD-dependent oxidoreductase [Rhodothermales bacterium]